MTREFRKRLQKLRISTNCSQKLKKFRKRNEPLEASFKKEHKKQTARKTREVSRTRSKPYERYYRQLIKKEKNIRRRKSNFRRKHKPLGSISRISPQRPNRPKKKPEISKTQKKD